LVLASPSLRGRDLLSVADLSADEVARGGELVDRPDALARGIALLVGVDLAGVVPCAAVQCAVLHRPSHLLGEALELLGVLVPPVGVGVAHDAHRLARVGA